MILGGSKVETSGLVPRPRLERLLAGAWERRIALIVAGGGYGKTTALRRLAGHAGASWLALTAGDREVEVLAARLAEVLGDRPTGATLPAAPAIGAADRRALAEAHADAICRSLDSRDGSVMVVLDDVDQLSSEDSATAFLSALCLQAPSRLHIFLGGRRVPALGLGAAAGRGELLELSAPDLAFTIEETASVLAARLGPEATALAGECWTLTTGWPAALALIADRLERLDRTKWQSTVGELRLRGGGLWRKFAADLVEREPASAQQILAIASVAPVIDASLLSGFDVPRADEELDSLQARGLLVSAGERGTRTISPVLADVVASRLPGAEAQGLRGRAVAWLEQSGRHEEALECSLPGARGETVSLLRRRGRALIAGGYGARVAEVLRVAETGVDPELEMIRAEALVAIGEWDAAMELFGSVARRMGDAAVPAGTAWRFGALLYFRGQTEAAKQILTRAETDSPNIADQALVSAWLSTTLWGRGELEEAQNKAELALGQAEESGDAAARAAAHVAVALCAAGRGDREVNERHYRVALHAATQAGDSVHLARIHANLSSKALEEGDYAGAVQQADEALTAGAGHNLFGAVAMCNKAEALMHSGELEEARALLVSAIDMFSALGSLLACVPYTLLGALDAERGDLIRARVSLERAQRQAEEADDVHSLVVALAGLAWVLAQDDPDAARDRASAAIERASSLERAPALCAGAWVELCAGNAAAAQKLALQAENEARRTGDRPSLARALELRGAAPNPPDEGFLAAAAELWREIGDPIALGRAELVLAVLRGNGDGAERIRKELSRHGVSPEGGIAGLVLAPQGQPSEVALTTLGRFVVLRDGQPVPLAAWQSRKARDLLKLLASRRGRPITRDAAAEALWPGEDPRPLSNRLSVALSTLRKVLDPDRAHPADHYIAADNQVLALRIEHISLDVVTFLETARAGVSLASAGDWAAAEGRLHEADALHTGDFLEEDLYEDWPVDCREEVRSAAQEVSRLLARAATLRDDDEDATRHLRRLIERDPYDGDAWTELLAAQLRMHRYGEARRQHAIYARRMAELDIPPVPLARTLDIRP